MSESPGRRRARCRAAATSARPYPLPCCSAATCASAILPTCESLGCSSRKNPMEPTRVAVDETAEDEGISGFGGVGQSVGERLQGPSVVQSRKRN